MTTETTEAAGKASLDPLVRTESFKGMCGGCGRFAKTSIADMRKAGRAAGEALSRIGPNVSVEAEAG